MTVVSVILKYVVISLYSCASLSDRLVNVLLFGWYPIGVWFSHMTLICVCITIFVYMFASLMIEILQLQLSEEF